MGWLTMTCSPVVDVTVLTPVAILVVVVVVVVVCAPISHVNRDSSSNKH